MSTSGDRPASTRNSSSNRSSTSRQATREGSDKALSDQFSTVGPLQPSDFKTPSVLSKASHDIAKQDPEQIEDELWQNRIQRYQEHETMYGRIEHVHAPDINFGSQHGSIPEDQLPDGPIEFEPISSKSSSATSLPTGSPPEVKTIKFNKAIGQKIDVPPEELHEVQLEAWSHPNVYPKVPKNFPKPKYGGMWSGNAKYDYVQSHLDTLREEGGAVLKGKRQYYEDEFDQMMREKTTANWVGTMNPADAITREVFEETPRNTHLRQIENALMREQTHPYRGYFGGIVSNASSIGLPERVDDTAHPDPAAPQPTKISRSQRTSRASSTSSLAVIEESIPKGKRPMKDDAGSKAQSARSEASDYLPPAKPSSLKSKELAERPSKQSSTAHGGSKKPAKIQNLSKLPGVPELKPEPKSPTGTMTKFKDAAAALQDAKSRDSDVRKKRGDPRSDQRGRSAGQS